MGGYLNPGSDLFEMALRSQIFVDKSGLIEKTNRCVRTLQRYICVSRPRRFGKSMGVDMLAAYYDRSVDTKELFQELKISSTKEYEKHLNQYDVLKINMQEFLSATENIDQMLMERHLNKKARRSSHKNHMKGYTMSSGHRFCTDRSGNGDQGKRTEDDDVRFAQSFEKLILMAKSKEGAQSGTI